MNNPATRPNLNESQRAELERKTQAAVLLLQRIARDFSPAVLASSMGAEDMVLTDLIRRNGIDIDIFTLDTGRLPPETYALMEQVEKRYTFKPLTYYPRHDLVEAYVRHHGINGFYDSVELRKACCHARKVEPLSRALTGRKAWVTGLRAAQASTRTTLAEQEFDVGNGLEKFSPLAAWSEKETWAYLRDHDVPYNALHDNFYPSIGCQPCTRAISPGEDVRAGRWWWENPESKECGLHVRKT